MGILRVARRAWTWSQLAHGGVSSPRRALKRHLRWALTAAVRDASASDWFAFLDSPEMRPFAARDPRLAFKPLARYQSNLWGFARRVKTLHDTYVFLQAQGGPLREGMLAKDGMALVQLPLEKGLELEVRLRSDPKFRKEGELGVFLELRPLPSPVGSFALSLEHQEGLGWSCRVGAVQGRPGGDEETIKAATKALHGFRPKAFLVFLAQEIARTLKAAELLGVGNAIQVYRAHAGRLQKARRRRMVLFDYDALWEECGGSARPDGWFRLPLRTPRRGPDEIKPNKRSMYAKRYALMDAVSQQIRTALAPFPR